MEPISPPPISKEGTPVSTEQHKKDKVTAASALIGLALLILIFLFAYSRNQYIRVDEIRMPLGVENIQNNTEHAGNIIKSNPFENIQITAKSAAIWDVKNKKFIYEKKSQDILPLASVTKLMTALAATEILPQGSKIRIDQEYLLGEDADRDLFVNEQWDAKDLMDLTLLSSSNSGARAIATVSGAFLSHFTSDPVESFVEYMNNKAKKLNLASLTFYNDSGLDLSENKSGAYGNARDVALLTDYIMSSHPEILEPTKHSHRVVVSENNFVHDVKNTNTIIEQIPGASGSKTGYTDLAQGNLVVTYSPGLEGPYIAVVLGSTYDGRFTDIDKLVDATVELINQ